MGWHQPLWCEKMGERWDSFQSPRAPHGVPQQVPPKGVQDVLKNPRLAQPEDENVIKPVTQDGNRD